MTFETRIEVSGSLHAKRYAMVSDRIPGTLDEILVDEGEVTLPAFLDDLAEGRAKRLYVSRETPDVNQTPPPLWELLDIGKYASMSLQYSRGCPFDFRYGQFYAS